MLSAAVSVAVRLSGFITPQGEDSTIFQFFNLIDGGDEKK
jgi:hypothetical protein